MDYPEGISLATGIQLIFFVVRVQKVAFEYFFLVPLQGTALFDDS